MPSLSEALSGVKSDRYGADVTPLVFVVGRTLTATEKRDAAGLPYVWVELEPAIRREGPYTDGSMLVQRPITLHVWQDLDESETTPDTLQATAVWHALLALRHTVNEGEMGESQIGELVWDGEMEPQHDPDTQQVYGFARFIQTLWRA